MNKTLRADLLLLFVALIWGATFPLVKKALEYITAVDLVNARFIIAAFFLLIWVFPALKNTNLKLLWAGFILGLLNAGVYLLQTTGMDHLDADTTAFISSVGVVFVPFLAPFFGLAKVRKIEIWGSLMCLVGLYILIGAHFQDINREDLLILFSAFLWAVSICYVQKVTPKIKEINLLAFYQVVFILPCSLWLRDAQPYSINWSPFLIFTIVYTGIFATGVVFLLQMRYQKETTATHAAIIYSLEPVLASLIAIYVDHQPLTVDVMSGGGIILLSILIIELFPRIPLRWELLYRMRPRRKNVKK